MHTLIKQSSCRGHRQPQRSDDGLFHEVGRRRIRFQRHSDLTVREIYEILRYLGASNEIIEKAPSAGLYEGQTDEQEMGIKYSEIDDYLLLGKGDEKRLRLLKSV